VIRKDCIWENNDENVNSWRGQHQTRPLKTSASDVDPVAVLEPDLPLSAPVDDPLPEIQDLPRWLFGTHEVGAEAEVPNESKVGERVFPEERIDLFDQREKWGVQIVAIIGEFGVEKTGIDVADRNELKGGVGREEDVGGNPIGGFPMPLCVCGANEFSKIGAPISERDG
jgi:hypothetical protein